MEWTSKHLVTLILLCFTALGFNCPEARVTNAVFSNAGRYEERIALGASPQDGFVGLEVTFTNVSGPLDISGLESLIDLQIVGICEPDRNWTLFVVGLNATVVSIPEGRLRADILKAQFENIFNMTIPYVANFTGDDVVAYRYEADECRIQKLRELFLEHRPSQGFGKIVTPTLLENYEHINFWWRREFGNLGWKISLAVIYFNHIKVTLDQEYSISLRELAGYSQTIQASPESSNSTLAIGITQVDKEFKLTSIEITPPQMVKISAPPSQPGVTVFWFEKTITGGSVDDLSIHFKIVSPDYVDPTTIAITLVVVAVTIFGPIVLIKRRKAKAISLDFRNSNTS